MKKSLAVLAAVLVGVLSAVGAARLIEPDKPPVVPPIQLGEDRTQTTGQQGSAPFASPARAGGDDTDDRDDKDDSDG